MLPDRLGARYAAKDGSQKTPVMLHRAILGSMERFIGILLENYEGKLPTWLAPVQAVVVSIKPEVAEYAREVAAELEGCGIRCELDVRDENIKQKIKEHSEMAVPFIIAIGEREERDKTITIRRLGKKDTVTRPLFEGCGDIEEDSFPFGHI